LSKFLIDHNGDYEIAIKKLKKALTLDFKKKFTAGILSYLALSYLRTGNFKPAQKIISELKKISKQKRGLGLEPAILTELVKTSNFNNELLEILNNLIDIAKKYNSHERLSIYKEMSKKCKIKTLKIEYPV
jgi:tetratricopeptide (TPR) repeat protein